MSKRAPPLKVRRFPIRENVYSRAITFLYGTTEQINAAMKRQCASTGTACFEPMGAQVLGRWHLHERNGFEADYICLVRGRGPISELSALAHEVLHHTVYTLGRAGLPPAIDGGDEAHCYYLQWVIRQCLEAIRA